jgi:hypothetical protein
MHLIRRGQFDLRVGNSRQTASEIGQRSQLRDLPSSMRGHSFLAQIALALS